MGFACPEWTNTQFVSMCISILISTPGMLQFYYFPYISPGIFGSDFPPYFDVPIAAGRLPPRPPMRCPRPSLRPWPTLDQPSPCTPTDEWPPSTKWAIPRQRPATARMLQEFFGVKKFNFLFNYTIVSKEVCPILVFYEIHKKNRIITQNSQNIS